MTAKPRLVDIGSLAPPRIAQQFLVVLAGMQGYPAPMSFDLLEYVVGK